MRKYSVFGIQFASELDLPEFQQPSLYCSGEEVKVSVMPLIADEVILSYTTHRQAMKADEWFATSFPPSISFAIPGIGNIVVTDGTMIKVSPDAVASSDVLRLYLLGSAMGCILHQRGLIPLHISTVFINGQAWGFTAPSGTGKSTLAARLHRFADCPMVSDDVAALYLIDGQPYVAGGPPLMKLSPEFAELFEGAHIEPIPHPESNKLKVQVKNSFIPGLVPLAGIVVLERDNEADDGDLQIEPLKGTDAFRGAREAIYRYQMGLAMSSPAYMFNKLTELTNHVPFYRGRLGHWTVKEGRSPHAGRVETAIVERLAKLAPQY